MYYTANNNTIKTPILVKIVIILAGILIGFFCLRFFITSYKITDKSMQPNLMPGDIVFAFKYSSPAPGNAVLIKSPKQENQLMVKRVIATEHESIEIKNKKFIINNKNTNFNWNIQEKDKRVFSETFSKRDKMKKTFIPANNLFIINDNLDLSYDSREFGFIKKEKIIGVIFFKI